MKECLNALRGQGYNPAYLSAWARKKSSRRMAWCAMQGSNLQPYDSKSYTVARNASPHRLSIGTALPFAVGDDENATP